LLFLAGFSPAAPFFNIFLPMRAAPALFFYQKKNQAKRKPLFFLGLSLISKPM